MPFNFSHLLLLLVGVGEMRASKTNLQECSYVTFTRSLKIIGTQGKNSKGQSNRSNRHTLALFKNSPETFFGKTQLFKYQ